MGVDEDLVLVIGDVALILAYELWAPLIFVGRCTKGKIPGFVVVVGLSPVFCTFGAFSVGDAAEPAGEKKGKGNDAVVCGSGTTRDSGVLWGPELSTT